MLSSSFAFGIQLYVIEVVLIVVLVVVVVVIVVVVIVIVVVIVVVVVVWKAGKRSCLIISITFHHSL